MTQKLFLYVIQEPNTLKGYVGYTRNFQKIWPRPPFKAKPFLRIPVSAEELPEQSEILIRTYNTHYLDGHGYNDSYRLSYREIIPPTQSTEVILKTKRTRAIKPKKILKLMYNKWGHQRYIPIEKVSGFLQRGWRLGTLRRRKGAKRSINPIGCRRGEPGDPRRKLSFEGG